MATRVVRELDKILPFFANTKGCTRHAQFEIFEILASRAEWSHNQSFYTRPDVPQFGAKVRINRRRECRSP